MLADPHRAAKHSLDRSRAVTYLACGRHAVEAFLRARPGEVREVLVARDVPASLAELVAATGVAPRVTDAAELERWSGGVAHQGVVATGGPPQPWELERLLRERPPLVLVVDAVTDPRNVGAIFRSAEAAGAGAVVLSRDHAPGFTPALVKAAAGAVEWLPHLRVVNLVRLLGQLRDVGYWVLGLDGSSPLSLWEPAAVPGTPAALVLGAEDRGLRPLVRRSCHSLLAIPMAGRTPSLNVSVAAALALFEVRRRSFGRRPGEP